MTNYIQAADVYAKFWFLTQLTVFCLAHPRAVSNYTFVLAKVNTVLSLWCNVCVCATIKKGCSSNASPLAGYMEDWWRPRKGNLNFINIETRFISAQTLLKYLVNNCTLFYLEYFFVHTMFALIGSNRATQLLQPVFVCIVYSQCSLLSPSLAKHEYLCIKMKANCMT